VLHAHLAALALAAGALATPGCGSSSKPTGASTVTTQAATAATTAPPGKSPLTAAADAAPPSGKPLTRAQWIAKGDAICARLAAQRMGSTVKTQQEFARALTQYALYDRSELPQLAKLVPPSSKENDWQEFLTGLREVSTNSVALAKIAQAGNFDVNLPLLATTQLIRERIHALARHDGFKQCSRV
jgi:hypothetical protein